MTYQQMPQGYAMQPMHQPTAEPFDKWVAVVVGVATVALFPFSILWVPFVWKRLVATAYARHYPQTPVHPQPAYGYQQPAMAEQPVYAYPPVPQQQQQPDSDGYARQQVNLTQEQLAETVARAQAMGYHVEAQGDGTLFVQEQPAYTVPVQPQPQPTPQPQPVADDLDDLFDRKLDGE